MIKLVLSDMDNTLLPFGVSRVSPRAISAIHALADAGVRFAPASGRGLGDLRHFFGDDPVCVSTALTCNGLEVYVDGECVESRPFERDSLVRAARVLAGCPGAGLVVYCGSGGHTPYIVGMRAESNPTLTDPQIFPFGFTQVDEVPDEPVVKAGVTCDAEQLPLGELYPRLCEACPELEFLQSIADWYDINPRGWSKADGVRILARHLGLGLDEIVAFGDQINDLEMLRLLPNSTAVANAVPAAAEAARWRIGACDEDGVAIAMEQILEVAGTDVPPAFMRG